jgi:hypothetical protein
MGFYVNVTAKQGCAGQINALWKRTFKGFLIYTPAQIKKEIAHMRTDPQQAHLNYVDSVKTWGETFPIYAKNRGQIFIRPLGYSHERHADFIIENQNLIAQINWILSHRLLFSRISGLQDAAESLDMAIDFDYCEDGKMKHYTRPCFSALPKKHQHPVYEYCLNADRPDLWQEFLPLLDTPLVSVALWDNIKHKTVGKEILAKQSTVWQRCEAIAQAKDGVNHGLKGRYRNGLTPPQLDIIKVVCHAVVFEQYLNSFSTVSSGYRADVIVLKKTA